MNKYEVRWLRDGAWATLDTFDTREQAENYARQKALQVGSGKITVDELSREQVFSIRAVTK